MWWTFIWISFFYVRSAESGVRVQTTYGPIEGSTQSIFNNKQVDAFLGVPYAAPPVGDLRFAPPQPPTSWNETLTTQSFSNACHQTLPEEFKQAVSWVSQQPESEDCLYLNVWRPTQTTNTKRAVLVWIHGGAYLAGSANNPLYDGSIMAAQHDVIVVTLNYRQSMFGFLYLNNSDVPGNAGIQDQIKAFKWVRENIEAFGGDPESVTLFGQSVGSISVSLHLVNPNIHDLFNNGIMQSGCFTMDVITLTQSKALESSLSLSKSTGCPSQDTQQFLKCMRDKTASEIIKDHVGIPDYFKFQFVPVRNGIEIPLDPSTAAQNVPPSKRKNILIGNVPNEGSQFIPSFFPGKMLTDDTTVNESELSDTEAKYFRLTDRRLQEVMNHEYLNFSAVYNPNQIRNEAAFILSDHLFICPDIEFVKTWYTPTNRVHFFYFNHIPSKAVKAPLPKWASPAHGDELPFVFGAPVDPKNGYTASEARLSDSIMKFWTNFAKTGNPNGDGQQLWPAYNPDRHFEHLEFNEYMSVRNHLKERECDFWKKIYPRLRSLQGDLR